MEEYVINLKQDDQKISNSLQNATAEARLLKLS